MNQVHNKITGKKRDFGQWQMHKFLLGVKVQIIKVIFKN